MKVVLSSRGSRGDVNPIIEIAALLQQSGHEVSICVPKAFKEYCNELGLTPSLYEEDSFEVMQNMGSGLGSLKGAFDFFSKSTEQQFDFMLDATKDADALVTTINEIAAPTIAEYRKIPHFRIGFSPVLPGKHAPPFMPWQNLPTILNRLGWKGLNLFSKMIIKKFVNGKRIELGLNPVVDPDYYHTGNSHTLLAINSELAPSCDSWENRYQYDYTGYCYGQIDGELSPDLQEFIDEGEAPIYIGFGSVQIDNPKEFTELIVEAVDQAGCRAIIGTGWAGLGNGHINSNIFSVGDTNHGSLFPKMAGIIHHGGSGTTHTAARSGTPQFILPQFYDQYFWGNSIYKNGVGPNPVIPKKMTVKSMVKVLKDFKSGKYSDKASHISKSMQNEDGIQKIAQIVTNSFDN
jgi:UDP:flavonoid glycosyltransferase YjiC (YdhE family)